MRWFALGWFAWWLAAAIAPPAALAEERPTRADVATPSAPLLHGTLRLSLAQAIKMGLENNLDVQVQRFEPFIAAEDVSIAWGAYDPEWSSEFGYESIETPTANVLIGQRTASNRGTGGSGGIRGLLPLLGSSYTIFFDSSRETTNSSINILSPELNSSFGVSFSQPLLRNLLWSEPWTFVKTTGVVHERTGETFRRQVMDSVRDIEDGYWRLIAADEGVRVAEKSLETARALLDQVEIQYEVGVVSKVAVVEAEAGVAQREFNLIAQRNVYGERQDELINLVLGPGLRAQSTLEIEPTDRPEDYVIYEIDRELAVRRAFANRPELAAALLEIERGQIDLKFRKNQRLPQFDLQLSYGNAGITGDQNPDFDCEFLGPPVPTNLQRLACDAEQLVPPSSYGDTFDDWFTSDAADQFTAKAVVSVPLGNVAPRHRVSKAELELRRTYTRKRRLEQSIILEVRKAVRDLESAQEGIEASERARIAAEEQLRAERIRLEYGESTPFDVLQREERLVEAERDKIVALRAYRVSVTNLDRAQGTILSDRNIRIEAVSALR